MWIFEKLKCVNLDFALQSTKLPVHKIKTKQPQHLTELLIKQKLNQVKLAMDIKSSGKFKFILTSFFNRGSFFLSVGGTHKVWRWCQAWLFPKLLRFRKTWESWNGLLLLCFADIQTLHFVWEKFSYTYKITVFWIVHLSHRLSVYYKH